MKSSIAVFLMSIVISSFLITGVMCFVFAQEPISTPTSTTDDFSKDSGLWQYLGNAYRDQTNQYLVLTEPTHEQGGVAFFNVPFKSSFTASFSYKVGGGSGGDGFTLFFYKQKYSTLGKRGEWLGFNYEEIVPGYGIEFDNWKNLALSPGEHLDPSANHIALIKDQTSNHLTYVDDLRTEDNTWHKVSVRVDESSITVIVDEDQVFQWNGIIDRAFDYFGFSGATGAATNWHLIDNFSIRFQSMKESLLTLSCESSTSYSGFNVDIKGTLASNGAAISNAPVLLSYSVTGGKSWEDLTLVYTGSDGSYSATWLPSVTGSFLVKATYEGDVDYLGTSEIVNFAVAQFAEKSILFSVSSNSTVSSLAFNSESSELSFTVNGSSETTGYVKATIAKSLVSNPENIEVYLDGNQLNYEVASNVDSWLLSFTYTHSTHLVSINLAINASGITPPGVEYWTWIVVAIIIVVIGISLLAFFKKRRR